MPTRLILQTFSFLLAVTGIANAQCISLSAAGAAYTQDFNTLANTGTSSTVPAGWSFAESGTNANTTYTAGTGSLYTWTTSSFSASGSTDPAPRRVHCRWRVSP